MTRRYQTSAHSLSMWNLASKTAIEEFNNLKQKYFDEYELRQTLMAQLKQYETANKTGSPSSSGDKHSQERIKQLEQELEFVKIQLFDAISEFTNFKNLTDREYRELTSHLDSLKQTFRFENASTQTSTRKLSIQPSAGQIIRDKQTETQEPDDSDGNVFDVISEYVKQADQQLQGGHNRNTTIEIADSVSVNESFLHGIAESILESARRSRLILDNQFNLFMEAQQRKSSKIEP